MSYARSLPRCRWIPRSRVAAALVVVSLVVSAVVLVVRPTPASAAAGQTFVVYGDSFTCQEKPHLAQRLQALMPYDNIAIRCMGGTAQCDWHDQMITDLQTLSVSGAMIAFTGNYLTPCITSRDFVQGYADDIAWAADVYSFTGVPMLFIAAPGPPNTAASNNTIPNVYAWVGTSKGKLVIRNESLFADSSDVYRPMMPFLAGECTDLIQVRASSTDGHLCVNNDCSQYASGVVRYAENQIHGVASLMGLAQPPYRTMVTPTPPGVPTAVSQTAATTASVTVNLTPPSGTVRGYQYSTDSGATWCNVSGPPLTVSTLTNPGCTGAALTANTPYTIRIRAYNNAGTGPPATVTTTTAPGPPSTLTQTDASGSSVTVSFAPPSGSATITNYQYSTNNGTSWCALSPADGTSPVTITKVSASGCGGSALAANTTYQVALKAVNAGGVSAASSSVAALTGPAAPTALSVTAATDTSATIAFTPPAGTIANYQYSTDDGATWCAFAPATTTSPVTVTNVSNAACDGGAMAANSAYPVRLRALGVSATGNASAPVVATTVAGAPSTLAQSGSSGSSVTVSFTPPPGTATVTNYQYSTDDGTSWCALSPADGTSPVTITKVSNAGCTGSALAESSVYPVQLRAVNAAGRGAPSGTFSGATGVGAPTSLARDSSTTSTLTVSFTRPNGTATILNYEYSTDDGATWCAFAPATTTSPVTVTSVSNAACDGGALASNTPYAFQLRAVTDGPIGTPTGTASATLSAATAAGAPGSVAQTAATATSVTLGFVAPTGSASVSNYQYSTDDGSTWCGLSPVDNASPVTVTNTSNGGCTGAALDPNTSYPLRLRAVTAVGVGSPAPALAATTTASAPTTLSRDDATGSTLTVSFTPPSGPAAVSNYQYSTDNGASWCALSPADASSPVTIAQVSNAGCTGSALAANTTYNVRLKAVNAGGAGSPSSALAASTTAAAPTSVAQASATTASVTLSFGAPAGTVANYQYSTDDGTTWCAFAPVDNASPVTISKVSNVGCTGSALVANTAYPARLRAVTAAGTGTPSSPIGATTVAGAPTSLAQASATAASLTVTFTAPDGPASVSNYQYSTDNGTTWCALSPVSPTSPVTITKLSTSRCNGGAPAANTTYQVKLRALNAAGAGTASVALGARTAPQPPTTLKQASVTSSSATVSFKAPAGTITNYRYSTDDGSTWCPLAPADNASPVTIATVSNAGCDGAALRGNTSYLVRLAAVVGPDPWNVSAGSAAVTVTTLAGGPLGLAAVAGPGRVALSWTAPTGGGALAISDYVIQVSRDNVTWTTVADGTSTATTTTVTGLSAGLTYYFQVAAKTSAGQGAWATTYPSGVAPT